MPGAKVARVYLVTGYTGWTARVRFPAAAKYFSLIRMIETGYGNHPASYSMGTGGSFV